MKVAFMFTVGQPWNRECPDCSTTFASVQSTGICPRCQLIFDVDSNGKLLRRRHKIGAPATPQLSAVEQGVKLVRRYLRQLDISLISKDEFNFNLLLKWVRLAHECWAPCAQEMPDKVAQHFAQYLDEYLLSENYKPSPTCFMVDWGDPDRIEQKKLELEPTYREIHEFWIRHAKERGITKQ